MLLMVFYSPPQRPWLRRGWSCWWGRSRPRPWWTTRRSSGRPSNRSATTTPPKVTLCRGGGNGPFSLPGFLVGEINEWEILFFFLFSFHCMNKYVIRSGARGTGRAPSSAHFTCGGLWPQVEPEAWSNSFIFLTPINYYFINERMCLDQPWAHKDLFTNV